MSSLYLDEKQLRRLMIDKDIKSMNELAQKSGVSKPTIYDYINGKSPLSEAFIRLCDCLEVKPSEILIEK